MRYFLCFIPILVLMVSGQAADLPPGGRDMLPSPDVKSYVGRAAEQGAASETVPVTGRSFTTAQRVILPQNPTNPWDAGARSVLNRSLGAGDIGLVTFEARALPLSGQDPEEASASGKRASAARTSPGPTRNGLTTRRLSR